MTITGMVNVGGQVIPIAGSGQADFMDTAFGGVITATLPIMTVRQQLVAAGEHAYMRMGIDGLDVGRLTHGRVWIPMSTYASGNAYTLGEGNPLLQLQLLAAAGNTVLPLGTSSIGGIMTSGYSVNVAPSVIVHQLQQQLAQPGLTPTEEQRIREELASSGKRSLILKVWVDHSGLLRRMSVPSMWGGTPAKAAALTMTFSDYGAPVNITVPEARDVISYAQFLRAVKQLRLPLPK